MLAISFKMATILFMTHPWIGAQFGQATPEYPCEIIIVECDLTYTWNVK